MSGCEWIVEAHGCLSSSLTDLECVRELFSNLVAGMKLHPVAEPVWHQFPGAGGITGLMLLSESHIACHTFPEYGSLCLNVFSCVPRPACDFARQLAEGFGASEVRVRRVERPYGVKAQIA
jgi:S-adenosylmethionine decarboxylase